MANGNEIVALLESNHVELWIDGGRLFARWTGEGDMPEGADMFIRRFKAEILETLAFRIDQERIAA